MNEVNLQALERRTHEEEVERTVCDVLAGILILTVCMVVGGVCAFLFPPTL